MRLDHGRVRIGADAEEIARGDEACLPGGADKEQQQRLKRALAPRAISITAPSVMKAVLSASTASWCGRCCQAIGGRALGLAKRSASGANVSPASAACADRGWA